MTNFNLFIPISKVDEEKRLVYGVMTAEKPDASGEIMDYATGKPEFEKWSQDAHTRSNGKSKGNVRAMHTSIAAGKLVDINFDDATKTISGVAKIVDDAEWEKVLEGVYTGFSIGGRYAKRWKDDKDPSIFRYTPIPSEVSIVDNPCLGSATFSMVKADGTVQEIQFKPKEQSMTVINKDELRKKAGSTLQQGWLTADNTFYEKRDEAVDHELKELEKREFSDKKRKELADKGHAMPDGSFPIEDEKDLKNAVHAVGRAKDPAKAKEHITARAKEMEMTHHLPAEWEGSTKDKGEEAEEKIAKLRKGMGDVARVACLIEELNWIAEWVKMEEGMEGDEESDAPAHLESIVHELCTYLVDRVEEETSEMTEAHELEEMVMELAAGLPKNQADAVIKLLTGKKPFAKLLESLGKAGARHSKSDNEHGAGLHKALEEMGEHMDKMHKCMGKAMDCHKEAAEHTKAIGFAMEPAEGKEKEKPVAKADVPVADATVTLSMDTAQVTEMLRKIQDEATAAVKKIQDEAAVAVAKTETEKAELAKKFEQDRDEMSARIKKLEDQPLPAKGVVFSVKKAHEGAEPEKPPVEGKFESVTAGMSPEDLRRSMFR